MAACKAFCSQCNACIFVSFSADHDDCSWYSSCDIQHLATTAGNYSSTQIKNLTALPSGFRQYQPAQELPSPRDANCLVDAKQTVTQQDNAAQVPVGLDEEWFAVLKEHQLAEKCSEPPPSAATAATPSYFWTVMAQNGNAPADLGVLCEHDLTVL